MALVERMGVEVGGEDSPPIWNRFMNHPKQAAFLYDDARYRLACAGIGGGKSEVAAFDLVRHCLAYPGIEAIAAAPTYRMIYRSGGPLPVIKRTAAWWGERERGNPDVIANINGSEDSIEFINGSKIWLCYASDPDNLRASEVSLFWLDEAALCSDEAFRILIGRCRQPGPYPHRGWLTTTPRGKNWVYHRFVSPHEDHDRSDYGYHHWTTYDNPGLRSDDLRAMESAYGKGTDWQQQEMLAEFVASSGLVYHIPELAKCTQFPSLRHFKRIVGCVDWGVTSPGCLLALGEHESGQHWVLDEVYQRGMVTHGNPGNDWLTEAQELAKRWGIDTWVADPSDANAILGWEQKGLVVEGADNARVEGVRQCQSVIAGDALRVYVPNCPNFVAESQQYSWATDREGEPLEDADPAKVFDHSMDAWRYGEMWLHTEQESEWISEQAL